MTAAYFVYNLSLFALFFSWAIAGGRQRSLNNLPFDRYLALALVSVLFYALVFGLRYKVGIDYEAYQDYYDSFNFRLTASEVPYEIGFYWLIFFLKSLELPAFSLFVVTCAMQMGFMAVWLRRYSFVAPWFFFFFFTNLFLLESLNGIRQALAFSILLNALPVLFERRFFLYVGIVFLASLFHASALVFFPLYFFANKNLFPKASVQVGLLLLAYVTAPIVKDFLIDVLPFLATISGYEHYSELQDDLFFGGDSGFGLGNAFAFFVNLTVISFSKRLRERYSGRGFDCYYNLFFIGSLLSPSVYLAKYLLLARLLWYFTGLKFVILAFLCAYLFSIKSKGMKKGAIIGLVLMTLYYIWFMLAISNGAGASAPYVFVFE
jgi:hypothetical protein